MMAKSSRSLRLTPNLYLSILNTNSGMTGAAKTSVIAMHSSQRGSRCDAQSNACRLRGWIALQALSKIVFRESGGVGFDGRGRPFLHDLTIVGRAFDAMTSKGGGNEFDQIFHRGS
jgi:hypothetical protein